MGCQNKYYCPKVRGNTVYEFLFIIIAFGRLYLQLWGTKNSNVFPSAWRAYEARGYICISSIYIRRYSGLYVTRLRELCQTRYIIFIVREVRNNIHIRSDGGYVGSLNDINLFAEKVDKKVQLEQWEQKRKEVKCVGRPGE
jgi:hypothetical protein